MLMVNPPYYREIKGATAQPQFRRVVALTEDQIERQRHMELAVRFLVHTFVPYNGTLDVEEYIDEGVVRLAEESDGVAARNLINATFRLLDDVAGENALRRFEGGNFVGKIGLVGLEGIAVGVAKNLDAILALGDSREFVGNRIRAFWNAPQAATFTSPGLRGTTRIQRTVPFGTDWFRP
jgi:hypothetical protein